MTKSKFKLKVKQVTFDDCKSDTFDQLNGYLYYYMRECKIQNEKFNIIHLETDGDDEIIHKVCSFADNLEDTILFVDNVPGLMNYKANGFIYKIMYGNREIMIYSNPLTRRLF